MSKERDERKARLEKELQDIKKQEQAERQQALFEEQLQVIEAAKAILPILTHDRGSCNRTIYNNGFFNCHGVPDCEKCMLGITIKEYENYVELCGVPTNFYEFKDAVNGVEIDVSVCVRKMDD